MTMTAGDPDTIDDAELAVLRASWHPVAFGSVIDAGPVGVELLGRPLVVFRAGGKAVVTDDRCPHRGSPLHLGSYQGETLQCVYHGLRFDGGGRCVAFPARPGARLPERLHLDVVESCEAHGVVWARLEGRDRATPPDWSAFDDPALQRFQLGPVRWHVSAGRTAENFNDLAHFSTIHVDTFGAADPVVPAQSIEETEGGFTSTLEVVQKNRQSFDGSTEHATVKYRYDFTFPFSSMLGLEYPDGGREWIQMTAMPESPTSCLVFQQSARTAGDGDALGPWRDFQEAVNEEDRVICEALRPRAVGFGLDCADEVALATDVFSIAYRRRWKRLIAADTEGDRSG